MNKLLSLFFIIIFSVVSFSHINYTPFEPVLDNNSASFSIFTSSLEGVGLEVGYYDYKPIYIENKVFNRTIRLKSGESFFKAFFSIPLYNEDFGLGYEHRFENSILGALSINHFQRMEAKNHSHNFYNFTMATFNIPSYAIGNLEFLSMANLSIFEITSLLYRPVNIPILLGYSQGFYINYPLVSLDRYYVDTLDFGVSFIEGKIYPNLGFSFPINILEQKLHFGSRITFGNDFHYQFYLYNQNLKVPLIITFNEKGGGLFFEF